MAAEQGELTLFQIATRLQQRTLQQAQSHYFNVAFSKPVIGTLLKLRCGLMGSDIMEFVFHSGGCSGRMCNRKPQKDQPRTSTGDI